MPGLVLVENFVTEVRDSQGVFHALCGWLLRRGLRSLRVAPRRGFELVFLRLPGLVLVENFVTEVRGFGDLFFWGCLCVLIRAIVSVYALHSRKSDAIRWR